MKQSPPVYFIFSTTVVGGSEKRFMELWWHLKQHGEVPVFCFLHDALMQGIKQHVFLGQIVNKYPDSFIVYSIDSSLSSFKYQYALSNLIKEKIPANAVLHYVLLYPAYVAFLSKHRTLYSLTESSLQNVNIKGRLFYWLCAIRSHKVDILDPSIFRVMKKFLFLKSKNIHYTPGSFVDTKHFFPATPKKNQLVFLGRFFYVKQIIRLVQLLPDINRILAEKNVGIENFEWLLLGYGQEEDEIRRLVAQESYKGINIQVMEAHQPEKYLAASKVIFSLQLRNNYPSKSLLEAMAAGNIPLVTDVGDTRKMADPAFSYYVPENFSAADIAHALFEILSLSDEALSKKMTLAREHVQRYFTIEASVDYYEKLYRD